MIAGRLRRIGVDAPSMSGLAGMGKTGCVAAGARQGLTTVCLAPEEASAQSDSSAVEPSSGSVEK